LNVIFFLIVHILEKCGVRSLTGPQLKLLCLYFSVGAADFHIFWKPNTNITTCTAFYHDTVINSYGFAAYGSDGIANCSGSLGASSMFDVGCIFGS